MQNGLFNTFFSGNNNTTLLPDNPLNDTQRGIIFTDDFPGTSFTNWTTFGSTPPTVSGGNVVFTSGSDNTTLNRGVRQVTNFSNLNTFDILTEGVQPTFVPALGTYAVGIGLDPVATNNAAKVGVVAYLDCSTGTLGRALRLVRINSARTVSSIVDSSAAVMPVAQNDVFNYTLSRVDNVISFTVVNTTQGNATFTISYTYIFNTSAPHFLPNRWLVSLYGIGTSGTTNVSKVTYSTTEYLNQHYILLGDSITAGYSANSSTQRLMDNLKVAIPNRRFMNLANQGNMTADYASGNANEITSFNATKAFIILVGTNDVEHGTFAAFQTAYAALISAIVGDGQTPILCTLLPRRDGLDVRTFNTEILAYAPGGSKGTNYKVINLFPVFRDSGTSTAFDGNPAYYSDTVHPNAAGFAVESAAIVNALVEFESGDLTVYP